MGVSTLREDLPDYAKDLRLNLGSVTGQSSLSEQQLWGTVLASAIASRNRTVLAELSDEAHGHLSPEAATAAKTAAALMSMNNIYYRSLHLLEDAVGDPEYARLPARLRMNAIANPGVDKVDFELWSLAVSAVNGCGRCLASHEQELRGHGTPREVIQDAIRVASVVHAVAVTIEAEENAALPA